MYIQYTIKKIPVSIIISDGIIARNVSNRMLNAITTIPPINGQMAVLRLLLMRLLLSLVLPPVALPSLLNLLPQHN